MKNNVCTAVIKTLRANREDDMLGKYKSALVCVVSLCVVLLMAGSAQATELIINGGFETGNYAGWNPVVEAGSNGNLFVATGNTSPQSGFATAGPASGTFYSITDQGGPGAYSLLQSFFVPLGTTSLNLSFDMFANDQAGVIDCDGQIDFNISPSECARVDLLTGTASAFDTGAGDIANFYNGADNLSNNPNPYTHYNIDLTGLVAPGNTYQIRFSEVDNQFFFQQGVDNVSITANATPNAAPEPGTLTLLGTGLFVVAGAMRRKWLS